MSIISLKQVLIDQVAGKKCCVCKKSCAKYLVSVGNETKLCCGKCITRFMKEG